MGTSGFAVSSLDALAAAGYTLPMVVTQPDRLQGRGHKVVFSPVKERALQLQLNVYQPEKLRTPEVLDALRALPVDFVVVVSYGQIIPESILELPHLACLNVHASLLPHYRGAAPIQRAIMNGERWSGISIMHMDKSLDTGDVILQQPLLLEDDWDHGEVQSRLAEMGAGLLLQAMDQLRQGTAARWPQDHTLSSYAQRILREDELIDWRRSAEAIFHQIRALSPQPGAYTSLNGENIKIFKAAVPVVESSGVAPGSIVALTPEGFMVQTGEGQLELLSVQRAGKKRIDAKSFATGQRLVPGQCFDQP